jgi:hypothetical protein
MESGNHHSLPAEAVPEADCYTKTYALSNRKSRTSSADDAVLRPKFRSQQQCPGLHLRRADDALRARELVTEVGATRGFSRRRRQCAASTSRHLKRSLRSRRPRLRERDCVCKKYATRDSDDAQHAASRNCSGTRQARPTSALPTEREFSAQLSRRLRREAIWDTPTRRVRPGCCAPGGLTRSCLSARPSVRVQSKTPPSQAE